MNHEKTRSNPNDKSRPGAPGQGGASLPYDDEKLPDQQDGSPIEGDEGSGGYGGNPPRDADPTRRPQTPSRR